MVTSLETPEPPQASDVGRLKEIRDNNCDFRRAAMRAANGTISDAGGGVLRRVVTRKHQMRSVN